MNKNARKLAVITGGTKGIGKALIRIFAENGFDMITCSRNEDQLVSLKRSIEGEYNNISLNYLRADLSDRKDVDKLTGKIMNTGRAVDVLVNNAGLFIPGQVHSEEEGTLEKMIETNLYSAYYLTRGLVGNMINNKSGHIFNICSTASIVAYTNGGSYGISKFALLGMSKVLREELKPYNIRVTSVLPGATFTASWEGAEIPEERFMKAEDVAMTLWNAYSLSRQSVVEEILLRPMLGDI